MIVQILLVLLLGCFNLILSAILNSEAMPPINPKISTFTALLYTVEENWTDKNPYPSFNGRCTGALIAQNWIITSKHCPVALGWKVVVGIDAFFKHHTHFRYNFDVKEIIDSIETNIKLVKIDRLVDSSVANPVMIHPFSFLNSRCYAAFWMNPRKVKKRLQEQVEITKKLHGFFKPGFQFGSICRNNKTNVTQEDDAAHLSPKILCLYPKQKDNPIHLCNNDLGAPYVCDGYLIGIITNIGDLHCFHKSQRLEYSVTILEPHSQWIYYFTERDVNLEASQECSISPNLISIIGMMIIYFLIL